MALDKYACSSSSLAKMWAIQSLEVSISKVMG